MRPTDPWKWPLAMASALVLMLVLLALPRSWIFLLPGPRDLPPPHPASGEARWLVLSPPPVVEVVPPDQPALPTDDKKVESPAFTPADWWRRGVVVEVGKKSGAPQGDSRRDEFDSVAVALRMLGVAPDLLERVRPDSLLAARLQLLQVADGQRLEGLKPYLRALARADAYADIMARAADMYNEFLGREIRVTPRADDLDRRRD